MSCIEATVPTAVSKTSGISRRTKQPNARPNTLMSTETSSSAMRYSRTIDPLLLIALQDCYYVNKIGVLKPGI